VLNAQAFNDSYLQPAMRLLQALTVSERHVLALMKMASSTSPHDAVCALVAQDATLLDLLRALIPTLVEPVSKPSVSAWQLARLLLLLLMPFLFMAFSFLIRIGKEEEASTSIAQAINWSTQLLKAVLSGPAIGVGMLTCFILALRTLSVAVLNESFHNTLYAVLYTLSILVSGYLLWCVFQVALSLVQSRMDALAAKGTTEAGQGDHLYVSKALVPFARSVCTALIVMTAIILLMRRFGDNTTSVLITSAFGFTIALTMSEVLKDWFAGAMVLSDNQYIVGDWVVIHGGKKVEGCVEEVSLRYTKVSGKTAGLPGQNGHGLAASLSSDPHCERRSGAGPGRASLLCEEPRNLHGSGGEHHRAPR
jgi:small-conductance mechanosensitive channel